MCIRDRDNGAAFAGQIVFFIRHKVEGFPFFCLICLGPPVNGNASLEHIAELLALSLIHI